MQGWVKDSPEPKVWPHKHFLLCRSELKNSCLWLPSGCSSSPLHLYVYLGVTLQTFSQKRSLLKNYQTSVNHTLPGRFRKETLCKKDIANAQHGSKCSCLEFCLPLVLFLVGKCAQIKQIFLIFVCR